MGDYIDFNFISLDYSHTLLFCLYRQKILFLICIMCAFQFPNKVYEYVTPVGTITICRQSHESATLRFNSIMHEPWSRQDFYAPNRLSNYGTIGLFPPGKVIEPRKLLYLRKLRQSCRPTWRNEQYRTGEVARWIYLTIHSALGSRLS